MKSFLTISSLFFGVSLLISTSVFASEEPKIKGSIQVKGLDPKEEAKVAKVSLSEATNIATGAVKGEVRSAGLEHEDGYLVYAVEIAGHDGHFHETLVDAGTGKILSTEVRTAKNGKNDEVGEEDGDDD